MPKIFTSENQKTGELGENIAVRFLIKHNFSIIERNYTKKWGEIDIVAKKANKIYFIEVKSVISVDVNPLVNKYETLENINLNNFRPEENMHPHKLKRLSRVIQTYLMSDKSEDELDWQLDLLLVYLDLKNKKAKIKVIDNIVL